MIRNAIIHLLSEQPMIADLVGSPSPGDVNLVCTNLRTLDGKRPVFIDQMDSTFIVPYLHIRFIEFRPDLAGPLGAEVDSVKKVAEPGPPAEDGDLEIDEDFLRRIRDA